MCFILYYCLQTDIMYAIRFSNSKPLKSFLRVGGIIKNIYPDYFSISIYLGSMCNNATDWPALPDVPTVEKEPVPVSTEQNSHIIKLLLAVICPVAILGKHFSHISSHLPF